MDMIMDMDMGGSTVKMTMAAEGDFEMVGTSPEDANMSMEMTMSLLGQTVEMDMITISGESWTREAGKGWEKMPPGSVNATGGLGGDPAAALRYLEQAKNLEKLNDEKVDGVDCHHYSYEMDADALYTPEMLSQLTGDAQLTDAQARDMLESAELKGEVWVGKEDLFPRRQLIDTTFDISGLPGLEGVTVKYDMQIDMRFSQINEPVEIKAPLD
jgi:hypothetical protein